MNYAPEKEEADDDNKTQCIPKTAIGVSLGYLPNGSIAPAWAL
jgi:hypothetical protein